MFRPAGTIAHRARPCQRVTFSAGGGRRGAPRARRASRARPSPRGITGPRGDGDEPARAAVDLGGVSRRHGRPGDDRGRARRTPGCTARGDAGRRPAPGLRAAGGTCRAGTAARARESGGQPPRSWRSAGGEAGRQSPATRWRADRARSVSESLSPWGMHQVAFAPSAPIARAGASSRVAVAPPRSSVASRSSPRRRRGRGGVPRWTAGDAEVVGGLAGQRDGSPRTRAVDAGARSRGGLQSRPQAPSTSARSR